MLKRTGKGASPNKMRRSIDASPLSAPRPRKTERVGPIWSIRDFTKRSPGRCTPVIRLHPDDNVVIARTTLIADAPVADGIATSVRIPAGHKVAVRPIAQGEAVRRYSQVIGFATADIVPGQHVHVHNMGMGEFAKDYAYSRDESRPTMSRFRPHSKAFAARTATSRPATTSAS